MNTRDMHRLLGVTAFLILVGGVTYSCKDFLDVGPQGALDEGTLSNQAGGEGILISAYRRVGGGRPAGWGCWGGGARNWERERGWPSLPPGESERKTPESQPQPNSDSR